MESLFFKVNAAIKNTTFYSGEYIIPVNNKEEKNTNENEINNEIEENQNDLVLASIYGRSTIRKSVPISIVDEYGYGGAREMGGIPQDKGVYICS
mgnify:CR=1 FL=1